MIQLRSLFYANPFWTMVYFRLALPSFIVRFKMSMANPYNLEFCARNSGIAMAHLRLPILSA